MNYLVARDLRKRQTPAEKVLWRTLRDRRLRGLKFRRQFPIDPFVADFCCWEVPIPAARKGLAPPRSYALRT